MIRSFQNADLPILHRLWIEHWSAIGPPPAVREAQLEQAVLARTFFRADDLLIAVEDEVAKGWLHLCQSPLEPDQFVIVSLCLGQDADTDLVRELLDEAKRRSASQGAKTIQAGVIRDDRFGYAGLDPIGHGAGLSADDWRLAPALQAAGWQPRSHAVGLSVSVMGFRPPVSREGLQYRRSTQIETAPFCFSDPRRAAGMSHLDVETYRLVDRGGVSLAEIHVWLSDPEAEVMNPSKMIVDFGEAYRRGRLEPPEAYLVAASIQLSAQRNILSVETAVEEDKAELLAQLDALQFLPCSRGVCWEMTLDH